MKASILRTLPCLLFTMHVSIIAQQVSDTTYNPSLSNPTFSGGNGPVVLIDEAHHNFHTLNGRYASFGKLLTADGYTVKAACFVFRTDSLSKADILVISNALNQRNVENWSLPTPSAFTNDEIRNVKNWIFQGGSLLLIADHMPFPGAASDLGKALGFTFTNGYAIDTLNQNMTLFRKSDGSLAYHSITCGLSEAENIDSVRTFTGQAFKAVSNAEPLLLFKKPTVSFMPKTAGEVDRDTPKIPVDGWYQGAVLHFGKGRIAVFGEAAMFTSQYAGSDYGSFGMTSPGAEYNQQFLLNVMHWLSGRLE
jgi:hypothetical protein